MCLPVVPTDVGSVSMQTVVYPCEQVCGTRPRGHADVCVCVCVCVCVRAGVCVCVCVACMQPGLVVVLRGVRALLFRCTAGCGVCFMRWIMSAAVPYEAVGVSILRLF